MEAHDAPCKALPYDLVLNGIKCEGEIKATRFLTVTEMQCRKEHFDKPVWEIVTESSHRDEGR